MNMFSASSISFSINGRMLSSYVDQPASFKQCVRDENVVRKDKPLSIIC